MAKTTKKDNTLHDDYIVVNETEEWLQRNINQEFANGDFFRIVMFYILRSPCKKGSYNPVKLESYGWKNPWHGKALKNLIDTAAGFTEKTYFYAEAQKDFKELWRRSGFNDSFYDIQGVEMAVFTYVGESNPYLDLLHHVRNCLAHGRFTAQKHKNEYYIFMEDVKVEHGKLIVNARIILKRSTLTKWIDIFECKTEEARRHVSNRKA